MAYTVFCIYNTPELLQQIEEELIEAPDDFTLLKYSDFKDISLRIKESPPSIIIIDANFGAEAVLEQVQTITLTKKNKQIPVVLALDHHDKIMVDTMIEGGFDDVIQLPCKGNSIYNRIIINIHRRKRVNKLLERSEQFSDISLAASKAGSSLIIIDKCGKISWVNQGFELLYECTLEEFKERFGENVFKTPLNSSTSNAMRKCIEEGEYVTYESVWYTNNNKRKNIQTSLTPIYDDTGKFSKIIAIETDITNLKMAEEALNDKHDNLLSTMEHLEQANELLDEQRKEIELQKESLEEEKNKSDALLLNILPEVAAHQLKKKGFVKPKKYNEVSTLFADFVNFSSLSISYDTIEEFLAALSFYFEAFDEITTKRFIEKIKTIGDCYMCVGGVPQKNNSHPFDTVLAALEIQKFVEEKAKIDKEAGRPVWRLRVGIHSGSVMAGVIGKKKFAYDVWGDTVNIASRMESKGEAGKVNISETTYNHIKDFIKCTYRGKVNAKNIGDINMYFVERILPEFSEDKEGYIPNAAFRKELAKY
ncbi:MAG: adenylate/guanylate cyclase domain-containing protein [Bacteroidales bacterium]